MRKERHSLMNGCLHECSVAEPYVTLCNPMDSSPPGSSVRGVLQARILEQVAISSSGGSSRPGNQTRISCVSCIGRWILSQCATWKAQMDVWTLEKWKDACDTSIKGRKLLTEHMGTNAFLLETCVCVCA